MLSQNEFFQSEVKNGATPTCQIVTRFLQFGARVGVAKMNLVRPVMTSASNYADPVAEPLMRTVRYCVAQTTLPLMREIVRVPELVTETTSGCPDDVPEDHTTSPAALTVTRLPDGRSSVCAPETRVSFRQKVWWSAVTSLSAPLTVIVNSHRAFGDDTYHPGRSDEPGCIVVRVRPELHSVLAPLTSMSLPFDARRSSPVPPVVLVDHSG